MDNPIVSHHHLAGVDLVFGHQTFEWPPEAKQVAMVCTLLIGASGGLASWSVSALPSCLLLSRLTCQVGPRMSYCSWPWPCHPGLLVKEPPLCLHFAFNDVHAVPYFPKLSVVVHSCNLNVQVDQLVPSDGKNISTFVKSSPGKWCWYSHLLHMASHWMEGVNVPTELWIGEYVYHYWVCNTVVPLSYV